jgi:hypothetical protein
VVRYTLILLAIASNVFADLSPDQKETEFRQLAGLYSKNYAPYEWKRDTQNFDMLQIGPWIERARSTKDDLDFADLMIEYVSKLNDGHDLVTLRSTFFAYLGFDVDLYDQKPLIEFIDRTLLPRSRFPFDNGDELVSVDGLTPAELTEKYWKYSICGNDVATRRQAALWFTYRDQRFIPRAHEVGTSSRVVIRRAADGSEQMVNLAWFKAGTPMLSFGKLPNVNGIRAASKKTTSAAMDPTLSVARRRWEELRNMRAPRASYRTVQGVGVVAPLYALPTGFTQRLGRSSFDTFYSGTFTVDGLRIGYIRIPDFDPVLPSLAVSQFTTEVAFMEANTDGMVIDLMRNPGGLVDYTNFLLSAVIPDYHRVLGFEIRANSYWVSTFSQLVTESEDAGDPAWVLAMWNAALRDLRAANSEGRGRTGPLALDSGPDFEPSLDRPPYRSRGVSAAYSKPLMVLVDEFTASGGDAFAATIQDNQRGILFGTRTMGLGGTVFGWSLDGYAEVDTRITTGLMNRKAPIATGGEFPVTNYIENVGVRPEIVNDYMTEDNLRNRGRSYVEAFSKAIADHIRATTARKETEQ